MWCKNSALKCHNSHITQSNSTFMRLSIIISSRWELAKDTHKTLNSSMTVWAEDLLDRCWWSAVVSFIAGSFVGFFFNTHTVFIHPNTKGVWFCVFKFRSMLNELNSALTGDSGTVFSFCPLLPVILSYSTLYSPPLSVSSEHLHYIDPTIKVTSRDRRCSQVDKQELTVKC